MRRFRALIKKEIIHMLRDPRTLVFIFIMPIMQLVLLDCQQHGYQECFDRCFRPG